MGAGSGIRKEEKMTVFFGILLLILMGLILRLVFFLVKLAGKGIALLVGLMGFILVGIMSVTIFSLGLLALPFILLFGVVGLAFSLFR